MSKSLAQQHVVVEALEMPDQALDAPFVDNTAPGFLNRNLPQVSRLVVFGLPLGLSIIVGIILVAAFQSDGQLAIFEIVLATVMALLSGWEAFPVANALIGIRVAQKPSPLKAQAPLTIAILVTMRDECVDDVIPDKLKLLRSLQHTSPHRFSLHILSDSATGARIEDERRAIRSAFPLPAFHHHRPVNTDFKSGNIRNWLGKFGASYDAFITLDADSEIDSSTTCALADKLSADPACGLIQTVPVVLAGHTSWQQMQSVASRYYGALQGHGLSAWMGSEANYYGHNAIIRTKAFAACAGLPHVKGYGLWNGTIVSHDFVEAALLRRAGWAVQLLPTTTASFEQAPSDVIAHLKRDARWCLGNFQHSRIILTAGLHPISRFHLFSGIFTYLSSALWLATLVLWATLDSAQAGVGGKLAASALVVVAFNLLLPRVLGVIHATWHNPIGRWNVAKAAIIETVFSSMFAPALMLQRVMIIGRVIASRQMSWATPEKISRSLPDYCIFHVVEVLAGLGLLALVERGFLTLWFLPLAMCLALTPVLSWFAAHPTLSATHEKLNETTPL